ncbi:MAG: hypothetical protein R2941_16910 [Desulfobacterales bacterium]
MIYGALPGEIFLNATKQGGGRQTGKSPVWPCEKKHNPAALCGGQTFRFLENSQVRCMLCGNTGTNFCEREIRYLPLKKAIMRLFLTREDALAHREWLIGMKSRFLEPKDELKKISLEYRK